MSLWQFSESSEPLLKQCIQLATVDPNKSNNKWVQKFGSKTVHFIENDEVLDTNTVINSYNEKATASAPIEAMEIDENPVFIPVKIKVEKDDFCREILDLEPVTHFDYIVEKCLENSNLYVMLAKELPLISLEKLCKHIYGTNNVDSTFLKNFYTVFFPAFLKREPTRMSLDLLVKAKCNAVFYKDLIIIILQDIELPSNVLQEFVSTLTTSEQTDFLLTLSRTNISIEAYLYHLATIHTAYKNSEKNNKLQNFIFTMLNQLSEKCITDKTYGRFLLNFLQCHRDFRTNMIELENLVDTHRSAFKKPCLNVLHEIKNVSKDS